MKPDRYLLIIASVCLGLVLTGPYSAFAAAPDEINTPLMVMNLLGGLALFLLGMEQMTDGLKKAAGQQMKQLLARLTSNRFIGALTGAGVTAVIQSSSVTTVLVVGFASAGLMTLNQSIGIIMGANVGTTITAQIVAFKVVELAMVFIAIGFGVSFFSARERFRTYGAILLGLGLIFFGMTIMGDAMAPLRSFGPFLDFIKSLQSPLFAILIGATFTALVQSSSATTGIVILMASAGFISLSTGIALALGANVGTCVTAVFAAAGKSTTAKRAAAVHILFNLLGVLLWLGFIHQLAELATWLSPHYAELSGTERLAAETPRQIANANTLFNLANTLIFIGFTGPIGRLVCHLIPETEDDRVQLIEPRYLNDLLLDSPDMALNMARLEVGHLGEIILTMLAETRTALQTRDIDLFIRIEKMDDAADLLYHHIQTYLNRIGKRELSQQASEDFFVLSHAADHLEAIGDILENDLSNLGLKMIRETMVPSETTWTLLNTMYDAVYQSVEGAIQAVSRQEVVAAQEVIALKKVINPLMEAAFKRQAQSLASSSEDRVKTLQLEFEITDRLNQIYILSKRMVRTVRPKEL